MTNHYPARLSPDGRDVAIRNAQQLGVTDGASTWRATGGRLLRDGQVADWPILAPAPVLPMSGSDVDVVGEVLQGAAQNRDIDPEQLEPIRDAIVYTLRAHGMIDTDRGPIGAGIVAAFDAVGDDAAEVPNMHEIDAALRGLPAATLRRLVFAADLLGSVAENVYLDKELLEKKAAFEASVIIAVVTVNEKGGVFDGSTVTVEGKTATVPVETDNGWKLGPMRIGKALESLGYRGTGDHLDSEPGEFRTIVEPISDSVTATVPRD